MRIVLRYYQLLLMYNRMLVSVRGNDTLNNPGPSDPQIHTSSCSVRLLWGISLTLKLISLMLM